MTADEQRSAHLLFAPELARGAVGLDAVLAAPAVQHAVASARVPSPISRGLQRLLVKRGRLTLRTHSVAPMVEARTAVLGAAAAAPPRFLVRMDEFPHYLAADRPEAYGTAGFERFHAIMRDAGVPYLLAVVPRVPVAPMDPEADGWRPHDAGEAAALARVARDPRMAFGVHGLDHRTRHANPRRHSELSGLAPDALTARLDAADAAMAAEGLPAEVFVAPFNRFDARQLDPLAARYRVVTGGPETVGTLGWHRTPLWRSGTVFVPAHAPLYGRAREILPAVEELDALQPGLWLPIVLHWGWEQDDGWRDLERLADRLSGLARPWQELLDAAEAGRTAIDAHRKDAAR